jgi:hypothetical protein
VELKEILSRANSLGASHLLDSYVQLIRKIETLRNVRVGLLNLYEKYTAYLNIKPTETTFINTNTEALPQKENGFPKIVFEEIDSNSISVWTYEHLLSPAKICLQDVLKEWQTVCLKFTGLAWIQHQLKYSLSNRYRTFIDAKVAKHLSDHLATGDIHSLLEQEKRTTQRVADNLASAIGDCFVLPPARQIPYRKIYLLDCIGQGKYQVQK